ncbi:caspase family protein (plasmid) [Hymenobacter tibetensis]|uniref:Caspase family protein n=1 Tax=Hymenobacter tibetensis TaxID=497967 RepID=A0ABY4D910_9BACT|nr:caspase family protein [Hymenobacter tibetensis]UOG77654.1 caspase family protein [Hymenobacter tibetensis]
MRAAICIGVDRTTSLPPLSAAAKGAEDFARWAGAQGCDVQLLVDRTEPVRLHHVFEAVQRVVEAATYAQLYIYFSGHGILSAPGTEYWLLSGAPRNPNEAINLFRSTEDARQAGIPHVIFVSDACRSAAGGAPLNGVLGGVIFPNQPARSASTGVDVFYATQPGDPAYEVSEAEAAAHYRGLFTDCLLAAVSTPERSLVEDLAATPPVSIITSHRLKDYLERQVPKAAAAISLKLNQRPQVRVETVSPKYFALTAANMAAMPTAPVTEPATERPLEPFTTRPVFPWSEQRNSRGLGAPWLGPVAGTQVNLVPRIRDTNSEAVDELRRYAQYLPADTATGFTIIGAELVTAVVSPAWTVERLPAPAARPDAHYLRLTVDAMALPSALATSTIVLEFAGETGALLAVLPGFIGVVVVERSRVVSVNYRLAPATRPQRGDAHTVAWEELKAVAAVTSRQGSFVLLDQQDELLALTRFWQAPDPTMALYLAYGYAERGRPDQVVATRQQLAGEDTLPRLFDLALLTARHQAVYPAAAVTELVPLAPLLAQGWALLTPDSPLYQPWHGQLRPHLLPSFWSTYTRAGLDLVRTTFLSSL